MDALPPLIAPGKPVKLVVWDLDHTLWDGVLLEDKDPKLFAQLRSILVAIDRLGILQSIASRNDFEAASTHLRRLGILEYFLAPRIGWSAKSESVAAIAQTLNIGLDSVLFVDDQDFELEEVRFVHPQVRALKAQHAPQLLNDPSIQSTIVTDDTVHRRIRYIEDEARTRSETQFNGPPEEFLNSLNLELTVGRACEGDLDRAEELVVRTNQLNSTGIEYSKSELQAFIESPDHTLLIASLRDRFGGYGKIGIALLEARGDTWTLKLILVSCRVLSRGIGAILLSYLAQRARAVQVSLQVEFRDTGKNRPMKVALMMTGFTRIQTVGETAQLYRCGNSSLSLPSYLEVHSDW